MTGGGTGIGRATALELAATGARVVVCGRRREPLEDVREELERCGGESSAAAEDISDNGWRAVERVTVDAVWSVTRTVAMRSMVPAVAG